MNRTSDIVYNKQREVGSRDEILQTVQLHLDKCCGVVPYDTTDPFAATYDKVCRPLDRVDWWKRALVDTSRLRMRDFRVNIQKMIGMQTTLQLNNIICAAIHGVNDMLQSQQRNGDWAFAAYEIVSTVAMKSARRINPHAGADYNMFAGEGSPSKTILGMREQERLEIRVAVVDFVDGEELDNWNEATGKPGSLANKSVPASLRREITAARDLIQRFSLYHAFIDHNRDVEAALADLAKQGMEIDLEAARLELKLDDAPVVESAAMTVMQVEAAAALRAKGSTWKAIAALVGVNWRSVRSAVQDLEASRTAESGPLHKVSPKGAPAPK